MRRILFTLPAFLMILMFLTVTTPGASARAQQQADVRQQVIADLNEWRIADDLWPFKPNATLDALALSQAEYLLSLPDLPDDMHAGRSGEDPRTRARLAGWPSYNRIEQTAIGEIAYAGKNAAAAIRWWKNSAIHAHTAKNSAYREVGAAVLPHRYGYLFVVVFGARPNVLPGLVNAGRLYLSNEAYKWAASGAGWVYDAGQFRLFDSEGRPLDDDWQAWSLTVPLPAGTGDHLYVLYSSGTYQALTEVSLAEDRVLLPASAALIAPPTPTPTPFPTSTPAPTVPGQDTAPLAPTVIPTATPVPAAPALLIVYDSRSLALVNVSGQAQDFSTLVLAQGSARLAVTSWQGQWLNVPLNAFPAQNCLQVWAWTESAALPAPAACRIQRGVITLSADRLFWTKGSFEVRRGDTVLATCPAGAGECAVPLP